MADHQAPGGFLQSTLPSPPPSSAASDVIPRSVLPSTRASPLKPGGHKQSGLIDHIDNKLLHISRRYEKRYSSRFGKEDRDAKVKGYNTFAEMAKDLDAVTDVVWVSGTPSLQIPYLLNIALTVCNALPSFSFSPRPTFLLLKKLDLAFCSLLRGANVETGEQLPGIQGSRGKPSTTENVRLKAIVERSRVAIVETAGQSGSVTEVDNDETDYGETNDDDDDDVMMRGMSAEGEDSRWEMEIARVYEQTVTELGTALDTSEPGGFAQ